MIRRFFISQFPSLSKGANILLDGQQHRHLKGVLRLKVGNQVEVFDGNGHNFIAKIKEIKKNETLLELESAIGGNGVNDRDIDDSGVNNGGNSSGSINQIDSYNRIDVATSLPKLARAEWLIEKLSEIGVSKLILLETEHSKSSPQSTSLTDNKIDRFERIIVESSKQSRNNQLMKIIPPISLYRFLKDQFITPKEDNCGYSHVFLGDPNKGDELPLLLDTIKQQSQQQQDSTSSTSSTSSSSTSSTSSSSSTSKKDILIFIGSEGGLSEKEVNIISGVVNQRPESKLYLAKMGKNILRMETAAIVMSSIIKLFSPFIFKNNNSNNNKNNNNSNSNNQ